jgi:spore maturation protein CgeB
LITAAETAASPAPAAPAAEKLPEPNFTATPRTMRPPRLPLKAAVIMDDFTYECFRDECNLIRVNPGDWQQAIAAERPDFLFVESTWKGNNGAWSSMVNRPEYKADDPLPSLVRWCRERALPTVFWNKEDPPNYDRFIAAAQLFDYIFTTDADCVPHYKQRVGHDRVFALPFAAQPSIHNPINSTQKRLGHLCFAGTYYQEKYPQRRRDIEVLLGPAASRGLTIFDRQHGYTKSKLYRFPDHYHPFIRGGLSYMEMVQAYKAYDVFLNINSVRESPTMFSRRVLELLACGTAVISTPSLGMERLLGRDAVAIVDSDAEAAEWMDRLIGDHDLRERMVMRGQRRVFSEHTYEARLREIIDKLGLLFPAARRRVSVVTVTNRPAYLERVIENYRRQVYSDKELILVLNHDDFRVDEVTERLAGIPDARVFQRPEGCTLGECLNFAVDQSQFEFIAKLDDDDFYAEHYLTDMIHAFLYCDTEIVGKRSYYAYLEHKRQLALRFPDSEHQHVKLVSGATLVVRRELFEHQRFPENVPRGVDTLFQRACADRGFGIYAADRFNFVATRSPSTGHTWQISDEEFMQKCRVVAETEDYRPHVVV